MPAEQIREAARLIGTRRAAALHGAAGLLPVAPGHRGRRAGQQHPHRSAACSAGPGCGRAADERPADRAEHPRVRRRRRPARLPQLGQRRRTSPSSRGSGTSSRSQIPHYAAADARDADLPLRRGGLDPVPLDHRHQPGGLAARAAPDPVDPRPGAAVPRRPGHLPDRDGAARRRRPAGGHVGREDRDLHQRRPHRAPVREGGRPARRGAAGPGHLPRLRAPARAAGQGRRAAGEVVATPRAAFEALEGVQRAAGPCDYTGHDLRQAPRRQRHPVAVQRRAPRRHRAALRRRAVLGRRRTTARSTAATWSPGRPSRRPSTRR